MAEYQQLICISLSENNLYCIPTRSSENAALVKQQWSDVLGYSAISRLLHYSNAVKAAVSSACLLWMVFHFPRVHALSSKNQLCFSNVNAVKLFTPDD